jgi:hypothetical protein
MSAAVAVAVVVVVVVVVVAAAAAVAAAVLEMMVADLNPCSPSQLPRWQERFVHC